MLNATNWLLVKSGEERYILDLQKNGTIYMNPIFFFDNADSSRRDNIESAYIVGNPAKEKPYGLFLKENDKYQKVANLTNFLFRGYKGFIYCLHSLSLENMKEDEIFSINAKGDSLLLIDANKFIERLDEILTKEKLVFVRDFIQYQDFSSYVGNRSPFVKDISYQAEREYRLYYSVNDDNEKNAFILKLGSIEEFSILIKNKGSNFKLKRMTE